MKLSRSILYIFRSKQCIYVNLKVCISLESMKENIESNIQWFVFFGIYIWILYLVLYSIICNLFLEIRPELETSF